ncbi:unnamed protein product [Cyclocybe aegerita]|uniref:Zn(2)-C6 fungal-type domain-containing protein n=1 Tax=Cyclocybe aegerita TaxID=1973307 RepID=A0A8S0VYV7_CYCAE|nr:unnamed protein product [Cyclocybe aegerita]
MKGPKRKRLAKACDACHKSKRRCDGTAPCSNCYYASKQCTYTDASGRPVPAPRPFKPERQDPSSSAADNRPILPAPSSSQFRIYPNPPPQQQQQHPYQADSDDEHKHTRKRFRNDRGNPMPVDDLVIDGPISAVSMDRAASAELDPSSSPTAILPAPSSTSPPLPPPSATIASHLTFFSPSALSPHRYQNSPAFGHHPLDSPADRSHKKLCPRCLMAQVGSSLSQTSLLPRLSVFSRCTTSSPKTRPPFGAPDFMVIPPLSLSFPLLIKEADLALQIVEGLGVHSPEHPTLTPVPSQEFVQRSIEREAIRRIFWLIHLLDVMASIYFKKPVTFTDSELRLRLPVDETSFELGVHSTLPEYLYLPAVRTQYASEFGHLIRIVSIYAKMEYALDELNGKSPTETSLHPETASNPSAMLMEAENKMKEWDRTLPEHLRFSEQSLQVQQSMFETSSNTGAWCWCNIHIHHASCVLALHTGSRTHRGPRPDASEALRKIDLILQMLGDRAKNSILSCVFFIDLAVFFVSHEIPFLIVGTALWSLVKYCKRDDAQIRKWAHEYEESWGTATFELVQDWRSHPSPPQQHQYPHPHSQQPQQQQHSHTTSHGHPQQPHQVPHRRLSDPPSYSGNGGANCVDHSVKRSPSHSPPISYPLGRPPNSANSSSSNHNSNRPLGINPHENNALPDSSNGNGAGSSRDSGRTGQGQPSAPPGSGVGVGPALGHGGNGSQVSMSQSQPQGVLGKFAGRDQANVTQHPRWPHLGAGGAAAGVNGGMSGPGVSGDVTVGVGVNSVSMGPGGGGNAGLSMNGSGSGSNSVGGGGSSNTAGQRNLSLLDGSLQLPSLKSSGLLDSWSLRNNQVANGAAHQQGQQQQQQNTTSPRRTTPPGGGGGSLGVPSLAQHRSLHHHGHSGSSDLRPSTTLAMPVGLQWLANESQ